MVMFSRRLKPASILMSKQTVAIFIVSMLRFSTQYHQTETIFSLLPEETRCSCNLISFINGKAMARLTCKKLLFIRNNNIGYNKRNECASGNLIVSITCDAYDVFIAKKCFQNGT